jgi:hypothetical protein
MNHIAIRNLYPNVDTIIENDPEWIIIDSTGRPVEIDMQMVADETARLRAAVDATEYMRKRALEYPSLRHLADAMYWSSRGDNAKLDAYYAACEAVKTKYPKGGVE